MSSSSHAHAVSCSLLNSWNANKDYEGIMDMIGGDIICIQETKITRAKMSEKSRSKIQNSSMATSKKYDAFFSFYRSTPPKGIHGTAIYTKRSTCIPLKAEEGLSELYIPSSLPESERIGGYPRSSDLDLELRGLAQLDGEGRATVVDLGMFVLINLYCPNETDSDRLQFKNFYNSMVDRRVRNLIKQGREVIVVGDLNICVNEIDSAEYKEDVKKRGINSFISHPPRKWLSEFVGERGVMIDLTRHFHPDRQQMFTCWNTKIEARVSNYGTRLDYILITPGLLPWIKFSDIMPSVTGSDHCPVYADFHEEREIDGRTVKLTDLLTPGRRADEAGNGPDPPPFATRFYDEFVTPQKTLKTFFAQGSSAAAKATTKGPLPPSVVPVGTSSEPSKFAPAVSPSKSQPSASTSASSSTSNSTPARSLSADKSSKTAEELADNERRSRSLSSQYGVFEPKDKQKAKDAQEEKNGQKKLSSFFKPPPSASSSSKQSKENAKGKRKASKSDPDDSSGSATKSKKKKTSAAPVATTTSADGAIEILDDGDSDAKPDTNAADALAEEAARAAAEEATAEQQAAWSNIFAKKDVPLCAHGEPCRLFKVNKPGINKGRQFYQCARPVGPGYQKERGGEATGEFRCGTWQWVGPKISRPAGMVPYSGKR